MDELDKKIVDGLYYGIPIEERPFKALSEKLWITEEVVIARIKNMIKSGLLKKFGATLGHREVGYEANAMVVWRIPPETVDAAGRIMARYKEISHLYERVTYPGIWEYNMFSMIHSTSKERAEKIAKEIADKIGIYDYRMLFSTRELKKMTAILE